eukprot:gene5395-8875_t
MVFTSVGVALLILTIKEVICAHEYDGRLPKDILTAYYSPVPGGYCLTHCVYEVPSSTLVTLRGTPLSERAQNIWSFHECSRPNVTLTQKNLTIQLPVIYRPLLPSNYDGWLAYTAFNISGSFSSFVGNISVPSTPLRTPERLYLFTGLQNKDWVPLHDPESEGLGFDVIQPVLQETMACIGLLNAGKSTQNSTPAHPFVVTVSFNLCGHICVCPKYVTLESGSVYSREVRLEPGDIAVTSMKQIGPTQWSVTASNPRTKESTSITPDHPRLATQPWAYNVMEAYGVGGCEYYPRDDCKFTGLELADTDGRKVLVPWQINPKPDPVHKCKEMVAVIDPQSILFSFQ